MVLDPHLIPGFEILGRLASGGVAEVFRARRERDGLEVALKVMSLADIDPEFHPAERFHREGELLERLNHSSLPRLYEHGVTEGELGWLALELVRGRPLSEYAGAPVIDVIPLFIQIAEGLQAVAQEGIVHRDISPDNVLVEERHGRLHARLIDFGIAKDLLAGGSNGDLTRHGAFIGKLAYASPEQLMGLPRGETLDFRSDLYSAGMTFYEVLSGRRAIEGENLPELVDAHMKASFPPLVLSSGSGVAAPRLVALVSRMIARHREQRPQSWEQVLAELWRAREEVSPLAETLARKRAERPGSEAIERADAESMTAPVRARLSREALTGRIVLWAGAFAFAGSVLFAFWFLRRDRVRASTSEIALPRQTTLSTQPPSKSVEPTRPAPPTPPPPPTHSPKQTAPERTRVTSAVPASRPSPRGGTRDRVTQATASVPKPPGRGILELALSPAGELDELRDEAGRSAGSRQPLPARLELAPGRYTVRLVARGLDCARSVSVIVKAGRTTAVNENCIEVK